MSGTPPEYSEWQTIDYALSYLARADKLPHRTEGERVLLDQISPSVHRVLDLGTGNGRLLALIKVRRSDVECVALDFSAPLIFQPPCSLGCVKNFKMINA